MPSSRPTLDSTDVGVDLGDTGADVFVDPGLGSRDLVVHPALGLVDALADDVGHLGLLTCGLGRHLVESGGEPTHPCLDVGSDTGGELFDASVDVAGDLVDVGDHARGLVVELANASCRARPGHLRPWSDDARLHAESDG